MRRQQTSTFDDIAEEFTRRVERMVWCSAASVDTYGRPRTRLLHPVWEGSIGWVTTHRYSLKARHLARNPYLSLAYTADFVTPVFVDCQVEWVDDLDQMRRIWLLRASTPQPPGFNPTSRFQHPENSECGLLKLVPWRIEVATPPDETYVWHAIHRGGVRHPALSRPTLAVAVLS